MHTAQTSKSAHIISELLSNEKYEEVFDYARKINDSQCYLTIANHFLTSSQSYLSEKFYLKALEVDPENSSILSALGSYYFGIKNFNASEEFHLKALAYNPEDPRSLCDIGSIERQKGNFKKAGEFYEKIIDLGKDNEFVYANMGIMHLYMRDVEKGREFLNKALEINPSNKTINFYNSFALFKSGEYAKAFKCYEGREWIRSRPPGIEWTGLPARKILVMPEQGYGDMIQFSRYIKDARKISKGIILLCPKELYRLFKNIDGADEVVEFNANDSIDLCEDNKESTGWRKMFDWFKGVKQQEENALYENYTRIMSVPSVLDIDVENQSLPDNLFKINNEDILRWGSLTTTKKKKVGLCWNSRLEDQPRSIDLKHFEPLFALKDYQFYSLQKDNNDQLKDYPNIKSYTEEFEDFYDTAAFIENLDLVISVDTAVVHLAGSLRKKTYLLLNDWCCWRWSGELSTFWYPEVEIFRQLESGDWSGVIQKVMDKLKCEDV